MRARVGVTESHKEPERSSESLREQVRAKGSQSGSHSYPFGRLVTKKEVNLTFLDIDIMFCCKTIK